ncbi:DUF3099 domain-containing protein [Sanguibacter sp. HDW7]|uniref:DUF3099 domain-containing protein n=1 Tax=Sanguibacter sp. HDW7 TaxID=2714931 RepID=UPI001F10E9BB|nr:DUF3099 domain-containing protein [Sanguibacter sp. HDW7]
MSDAPEPLAVEQARRMRSYLVQMGIRVVCIALAAAVPSWPLRWVCIAAAVVLPYTAVLVANAGRDRRTTGPVMLDPRALPAAPHDDAAPDGADGGTTPPTTTEDR